MFCVEKRRGAHDMSERKRSLTEAFGTTTDEFTPPTQATIFQNQYDYLAHCGFKCVIYEYEGQTFSIQATRHSSQTNRIDASTYIRLDGDKHGDSALSYHPKERFRIVRVHDPDVRRSDPRNRYLFNILEESEEYRARLRLFANTSDLREALTLF